MDFSKKEVFKNLFFYPISIKKQSKKYFFSYTFYKKLFLHPFLSCISNEIEMKKGVLRWN